MAKRRWPDFATGARNHDLETVADAIGATEALYRGRDVHLLVKLDWCAAQPGPQKPLLTVTADDIDEGICVLLESPKLSF